MKSANQLVLLAALLAGQAHAQDSAAIAPGVVGADGGWLYVMEPGNQIAAMTSDGTVQWRSTVAHKPLFQQGAYVVAQIAATTRGELQLAVLRHADGTVVRTQSVPLPAEVLAGIDETLTTRFTARARFADGAWYVVWSYTEQSGRGAQLNPEDQSAVRDLDGALRIDLVLPAAELAATPLAPDAVPDGRDPATPLNAVQLWEARQLLTDPARVGDHFVAVDLEPTGALIRRWDAGTGDVVTPLDLPAERSHVYNPSANRQFVAVTEKSSDIFYQWRWAVHSLADGERVGVVPSPYAIGDYDIIDGTLVYVAQPWERLVAEKTVIQPLSLKGHDLESGTELWSIEIRDTRYWGPYPP